MSERHKHQLRGRKRGYRAEVRRERKKRDILSPVNVLKISFTTHLLIFNISDCFRRSNIILKKNVNLEEKFFMLQRSVSSQIAEVYGVFCLLRPLSFKQKCTEKKKRAEARRKGGLKTSAHNPLFEYTICGFNGSYKFSGELPLTIFRFKSRRKSTIIVCAKSAFDSGANY